MLPVHLFGYPADMDRIEALASQRGLGIVEDACEAFGAVDSGGMKVGSRGNIATFAFYANKQIATGEGGMLVSGDSGLLRQARSERNQGRGDDMDWLAHDRLGFNYRLSDVAAALGVAQIERADDAAGGPCAGGGYVLRAPVGRGWADAALRRSRSGAAQLVRIRRAGTAWRRPGRGDPQSGRSGECSPRAICPASTCSRSTASGSDFAGGEFPVAEDISARSLALPFFGGMNEAQVDRVCAALAEVLASFV